MILLTELTKNNTKFKQFKKAQKAFDKLKKIFTSQLILRNFEPEKLITLKTVILNKVKSVYISQSDNKKHLRSVAYYLRKLTNTEMNYKIHNKKLLVIINTFKQ